MVYLRGNRNNYRKRVFKLKRILLFVSLIILIGVCIWAIYTRNDTRESKEIIATTEAPTDTPTIALETDLTTLLWPEDQTISAKILMYHHIGTVPDGADDIRKGLTVSTENLSQQIDYLLREEYKILTLSELYEAISKGEQTKNIAVLTFDDGYDDNYYQAFATMKAKNVKGTFFIISEKIGNSEYMNKEQIRELSDAGNEIASHSLTHPSLEKISSDTLKNELEQSKSNLEDLTGKKIYSFCYPSGKYSQSVIDAVKKAGYLMAVTTKRGNDFSSSMPFEIPRYRINPSTNISTIFL